MKGTEQFKKVIEEYLDARASTDELFAKKYAETTRSIDDVVTYILNQVKSAGICGWTDEEIFSMAIHAIDEPEIEIGKPIQCEVVVNRQIQLTEEEIKEAKEKAIQQLMREEMDRQRSSTKSLRSAKNPKATPKPKAQTETAQQPELSLFDF